MIRDKRDFFSKYGRYLIIIFFISSRIVYYIIGIRFDGSSLGWFFQFLDPTDLHNNFLQSLLYLHTQPPGFNLFLGIILKLFNGYETITFQLIYIVFGLLLIISIYKIFYIFEIPHLITKILLIFFIISPPLILYENWLFYTYPITLLLTISTIFLYQYLRTKGKNILFLFFFSLFLIAITRSLFHLLWYIFILFGLIIFETKEYKKILWCGGIPLLLILSLYLKNFIIFKDFGLSSWFGMNLTKLTFTVPLEKIKPLVRGKNLSEIIMIKPFSPPGCYQNFANFDTITTIPVLDKRYKSTGAVNFNHIGYLSVSRQYAHASISLLNKYPNYYGLSVIKSFYAYLRPSSDSIIMDGQNRRKIQSWVNFYEKYIIGDILQKIWHRPYVNRFGGKRDIHLNFLYLFIPLIYGWGILLSINGRRMLGLKREELIIIGYIMFNIIYVTIVGNLLDVGENMRFRFLVLPFTYVLLGL